MNTKERFVEYLKSKGIGQTSFEEASGLSRGAISQKSGFSANSIEKIAAACPDLNIDWLITGKGPMFKSEQPLSIMERLKHFIEEQDITETEFCESIDMPYVFYTQMKGAIPERHLKNIIAKYPDLSIAWLMAGEGNMLKSEYTTLMKPFTQEEGTPLLPVEAWGGSLSGSSIAILAEQCKKYNVPISNIDYLIPIAGDSMMPDYCPGDVVAIKRVNEKAFIEWGKVYVLDTCNGVVIKEVQPSENEGYITCISRNTPAKYKPFEINLCPENFYGMYAVKGTVRIS